MDEIVDEIALDTSNPAMTEAIENNIAAFYMQLGRGHGAELHIEDDLTWFVSGIPTAQFNGVIQTRLAPSASSAEIGSRIAEMVTTFTSRALPMVWWVTPSTSPPDLAAYLTAHGFSTVGTRPGMAVELAVLPEHVPPAPGLEITAVTDTASYETWIEVFAASYGYQAHIAQSYFEVTKDSASGSETSLRRYLAWLDGKPVATTTLFVSAGIAGLYQVGTLPEARNRGIGTAILLAPLLDAQALGLRHAVLFSSPMGLSIYRRLGFKVYCQLDRYVRALP